MKGIHWILAPAVMAVFLPACSDSTPASPAPPQEGTLEVATTTTGEDVDPAGYTVRVDDEAERAIGPNATLTIPGLPAGERAVELVAVAANCVVAGDNPRTVVVEPDGTTRTEFAITCTAVVPPAPLIGRIVFSSDRAGSQDIYVMDANGSGQTRLTTEPGFDGVPAISPDGTKILFETDRDGHMEVYVMNVDGTEPINLTNHPGWDQRPSWSPDGTKVLFVSGRDGGLKLFVMNADGSDPERLTDGPDTDRPAAWSPDGTRIAFSSNRSGAYEIYVMNADGSDPVALTDTPGSADFAPAWSPDGTRIAFTSRIQTAANAEVHMMNADGSGRVNLTDSPESDDRWPSWSPDGAHIVFTTNRTGTSQVFVMDSDGTHPVNLSNTPGFLNIAGWPQAWGPASP
jgi:Tol biopolymer transport system component